MRIFDPARISYNTLNHGVKLGDAVTIKSSQKSLKLEEDSGPARYTMRQTL